MPDADASAQHRVILLGAGGHARVVLEAVARQALAAVVGLLDDDPAKLNTSLPGPGEPARVLGAMQLLHQHADLGADRAVVAIGSNPATPGHPTEARARAAHAAAQAGVELLPVLDPHAVVSATATVAPGAVILAGAVIQAGARLHRNCLINTRAVIEHDAIVEEHAHVAPGALVLGAAQVRRGAHIGAGAVILQQRRVGEQAVVGAGSVVLHDVEPGATVAGAPARPLPR